MEKTMILYRKLWYFDLPWKKLWYFGKNYGTIVNYSLLQYVLLGSVAALFQKFQSGDEEELSKHEKLGIFISMDTGEISNGKQSKSTETGGERNSNEVDGTCRFKGEEISLEKESETDWQ